MEFWERWSPATISRFLREMPGRPSTFPVATEGPPVRIQFEMGYDAVRDRIVLFGSVNNKLQWVLNDLWESD